MHSDLCKALLDSIGSAGIQEHHLCRLLRNPKHLHFSLKFALCMAELEHGVREPLQMLELPNGGLAFQQPVEPMPFAMKDWQTYIRQRNAKVPDHRQCSFDTVQQERFTNEAFNVPLEPAVSSIYLVETSRARIQPAQAHQMLQGVAPESALRTQPILTFEVLRYLWDEMNNLNAAYVVINAAIRGVGFPVIFNSLSTGKRITFVPGVPHQHAAYTGYYACCA